MIRTITCPIVIPKFFTICGERKRGREEERNGERMRMREKEKDLTHCCERQLLLRRRGEDEKKKRKEEEKQTMIFGTKELATWDCLACFNKAKA